MPLLARINSAIDTASNRHRDDFAPAFTRHQNQRTLRRPQLMAGVAGQLSGRWVDHLSKKAVEHTIEVSQGHCAVQA
jgi:hypothetical protein